MISLSITIWPDVIAAYFLNYFLFPKYLLKRKYVGFVVGFVLSAGLIVLLQHFLLEYVVWPITIPDKELDSSFWSFNPFYSIFNIYSVVAVFTVIKLFKYYYEAQRQKDELEKQNRTSELALLKSQVNPHFLFNTLNNIDSLVAIDPGKASDAIIKLSDIMRYMLYDTATDKVLLEKEINYLRSYIALQELRFKQSGVVQFDVSGLCSGYHIAPMLFIPFVENAFKHGEKTGKGSIIISLECSKEKLVFIVSNHYDARGQKQKDKTKGIGLSNVKRRLNLLYPDKYDLEIGEEEGEFVSKLQITMT
jgi:sensor histidine kinase YesM